MAPPPESRGVSGEWLEGETEFSLTGHAAGDTSSI